jgi:hypothetical protein
MIRQAHTYMVSAMSGAMLIALAIAVFVVLVSAQVFKDWPIAALGDHGSAGASDARPAHSSAVTTIAAGGSTAKSGSAAGAVPGTGSAAAKTKKGGADLTAVDDGANAPAGTGVTAGGEKGDSGGSGGSGNSTPTSGANPPGPTASSPASGSPSGGGSASSGSGGGSSGSSAASTPAGQVTETVNETVNQVDETALGGTLNGTGVTEVTEGVVNGVAGPESVVGKAVDETVGVVGGLLYPGH